MASQQSHRQIACGFSTRGSDGRLSFELPEGTTNPTFQFISCEGGYQGQMRANGPNGLIGYDSAIIPSSDFQNVGKVKLSTGKGILKVDILKGGKLEKYFV